MKRARDSADSSDDPQDHAGKSNQRVSPGVLNQSPVAATSEADDDPYGFGKIGAPGFVSKPSSMKAGFVPGYLRIPGCGGAMAPKASPMKSARTSLSGPGATPRPASHAASTTQAAPQTQTQAFQAQSPPTATTALPAPQFTSPAQPAAHGDNRNQHNLMLQRKRVQNKDLPEQHRLPDLPAVVPGNLAKTSASVTGPISAQTQPLAGFHDELETFVEKASPNQAEQLTKVCLGDYMAF